MNPESVIDKELPECRLLQNPTYQTELLGKKLNKKLFAKDDFLADKFLSCPGIKLSNSLNLKLDAEQTELLLSDFSQQLRCKIADVADIYVTLLFFALLDAAGIYPTLALNQNAKVKERGSWFFCQI